MGMSSKINQMVMNPFPRCLLHRIACRVHLPQDDEDISNPKQRMIIKLVNSNGVVQIYDKPIRALDLMNEFPKHLICRSDCFYIGQKTQPLSQHDRLQPGHNYFLLPAIFFQSALSFAAVLRCQSAFSGRTSFDVEKTPSGGLRIKVFEDVMFEKQREQLEKIIGVCTTPQLLRKDYEQLVGRRRHWKPKLDTIAEKKKNRSMKNKLV